MPHASDLRNLSLKRADGLVPGLKLLGSRRSSVPLVLGSVLSLGIIVLAWRKLGEWHGPAALLGATVSLGYVAWVLWEQRVSAVDVKHPSVQADRWTVEGVERVRACTLPPTMASSSKARVQCPGWSERRASSEAQPAFPGATTVDA